MREENHSEPKQFLADGRLPGPVGTPAPHTEATGLGGNCAGKLLFVGKCDQLTGWALMARRTNGDLGDGTGPWMSADLAKRHSFPCGRRTPRACAAGQRRLALTPCERSGPSSSHTLHLVPGTLGRACGGGKSETLAQALRGEGRPGLSQPTGARPRETAGQQVQADRWEVGIPRCHLEHLIRESTGVLQAGEQTLCDPAMYLEHMASPPQPSCEQRWERLGRRAPRKPSTFSLSRC